jgi:hypothetical protein
MAAAEWAEWASRLVDGHDNEKPKRRRFGFSILARVTCQRSLVTDATRLLEGGASVLVVPSAGAGARTEATLPR